VAGIAQRRGLGRHACHRAPSPARRRTEVEGLRPFFCQVEAVETVIWLTEVASGQKRYAHLWKHLKGANNASSAYLLRVAMKMATGAGKTTVMAMLIAWQAVNAVCSPIRLSSSRRGASLLRGTPPG
jgi:type III restriction enzyme